MRMSGETLLIILFVVSSRMAAGWIMRGGGFA